MQVTELESQGLKKKFKVVVNKTQIDTAVEAELREAGKQIKIPGFRPGYIPMKVLQQRYGKSVRADAVKQVIQRTSAEVISDKKIRPVLAPQITIEDYKEGEDVAYSMVVESFPEMPEIDLAKVTLKRSTFEITEKDIDEAQARVAEQNATFVAAPADTKASLGNVVTIDFKGMIDGVAFEGGTAADFDLELGSHRFIEGFEEQLVDTKAGDKRDVKVTFPQHYQAKELAGKDAVFEVDVKAVKTKQPGVIDEEFAKARGFDSVEKIRDAIKAQMTNEYNNMVRNQLKKELFDALEEKCEFVLPESMVELEFNSIWERMQQAKAQGDTSEEGKSDDELKAEYREIAKRRVKLGLYLAEVGNKQKIQISREELMRSVVQQASMFPGQEKMVMDFYRNNPERLEDLRGPILEEKAVDYLLSKVAYDDYKVSLEALAKADADEEADAEDAPKKKATKKKASK